MKFGLAIRLMQEGNKVQREGFGDIRPCLVQTDEEIAAEEEYL